MKTLIVLYFLIPGTAAAPPAANCAMNAMTVFPAQQEISSTSSFMLQGYRWSQKTIRSFKEYASLPRTQQESPWKRTIGLAL